MDLRTLNEPGLFSVINGMVSRQKALWTLCLICLTLFLSLGLWNWNIEHRASRDRLAAAAVNANHQASIVGLRLAVRNLTDWTDHQQRTIDSLNTELRAARSFAAVQVRAIQTLATRLDRTNRDLDEVIASDQDNVEWLNEQDLELTVFRPLPAQFDSLRRATVVADSTLNARQRILETRLKVLLEPKHRHRWWLW